MPVARATAYLFCGKAAPSRNPKPPRLRIVAAGCGIALVQSLQHGSELFCFDGDALSSGAHSPTLNLHAVPRSHVALRARSTTGQTASQGTSARRSGIEPPASMCQQAPDMEQSAASGHGASSGHGSTGIRHGAASGHASTRISISQVVVQ